MPQYQYKARDKEGNLRTGSMEAGKKENVADRLAALGLIPVFIQEQARSRFAPFPLLSYFKKVPPQDLIVFSRQLATLLTAGIPFIKSLSTMEKQTENSALKKIISLIRRDLEAGSTFSDALAKHPSFFSKLYVGMIRAGETAGILDEILNRLALLTEHEVETRERVKAAVRYPLIVIISIGAAFAFLVSFVIPRFAAVFSQFKTELPLPTRILIGINFTVQHYWYFLVFGIAGLVAAVKWYIGTPRGRIQWDSLKLKLPVFGILFKKVALSRFARMFSAMQKSGLSMIVTLELAGNVTGNAAIAKSVEKMRESLRQGKGLVQPMEQSGLFPPLVVQMMSVGEETGQIDAMLNKVSDYYDKDVEYTIKNLSTMIEPVLLLFVGGMVLFLALGIFLPMWNMMSLFRK